MMEVTEILNALRGGLPPTQVYEMAGSTERAIRTRMERAGLTDEYRAAIKASKLFRSRTLGVERVMDYADRGQTLTSACIDLGIEEGIVRDRLVSDDRWVEFNARWMAARTGSDRPAVSPARYHDGPRVVLVSAIGHIPESERASFRDAVSTVDSMVSAGGELSRLCWGEMPCIRS